MEITTAAIDLITVLESPLNIKKKKERKKLEFYKDGNIMGFSLVPISFPCAFTPQPIFLIGEMVIHVI